MTYNKKIKFLRPFQWMMILLFLSACELSDIPSSEDLSSLVNTWVVDQVLIDGQEDVATNYSNYRLIIDNDNTYQLTDIYGQTTSGTWEVSNDSQLVLISNVNEQKAYIIAEISQQQLILLFKDKFIKETEASYRFILIPEG